MRDANQEVIKTMTIAVFGDKAADARDSGELHSGASFLSEISSPQAYRSSILVTEAIEAGLTGHALARLFLEMATFVVEGSDLVWARAALSAVRCLVQTRGPLAVDAARDLVEQLAEGHPERSLEPAQIAIEVVLGAIGLDREWSARCSTSRADEAWFLCAVLFHAVALTAGAKRDEVIARFSAELRAQLFTSFWAFEHSEIGHA